MIELFKNLVKHEMAFDTYKFLFYLAQKKYMYLIMFEVVI